MRNWVDDNLEGVKAVWLVRFPWEVRSVTARTLLVFERLRLEHFDCIVGKIVEFKICLSIEDEWRLLHLLLERSCLRCSGPVVIKDLHVIGGIRLRSLRIATNIPGPLTDTISINTCLSPVMHNLNVCTVTVAGRSCMYVGNRD